MSSTEHTSSLVGKTLAHYELESAVGEGGSGVVYRARDLRLDRRVAVKVLADALRDDELAWGRLLREARLASQLNHPQIAAIYDLGEDDGRAYIVMEYVDGLPLAELISDGGMPMTQVVQYGSQIAGALGFAHQRGIIHGDLKGSNILVTPDGNIKLLDFGLGRRIPRSGAAEVTSSNMELAAGGATAGTLPYLAPELLRGSPTSLQTDVWALGVLVYQMATGQLPFRGTTGFELSLEILTGSPRNVEHLPEPVRGVIGRCLERDPQARLARASEVADALSRGARVAQTSDFSGDAVGLTASDVLTRKEPTALRSRRLWWAAGAATIGLVLVLAVLLVRHAGPARTSVPAAGSGAQAVRAPAAGVKVWVNTDSGTYHCPGSRWYGKTHSGEYMTQKQAESKGYRPAGKHACL